MADNYQIFPPDSRPLGFSYAKWSEGWWKWLLAIPRIRSPAFDENGKMAAVGQYNPRVFFLCQTWEGTSSMPERKVTIPVGKAVFLPVINWICLADNGSIDTRNKMIATSKRRMDVIGSLEVSMNGENLKENLMSYRTASRIFKVYLPENNILGYRAGIRYAVSDGYWLFMKLLGDHFLLRTFGSCSSGATQIGVKYNIRISTQ